VDFINPARIRLMGKARFPLAVAGALALAACARHQATTYIIDPATGQPVPVVAQRSSAPPQPGYGQQQDAQAYAQPSSQQQETRPQSSSGGRGFFTSRQSASQAPAEQPHVQQSYVLQYSPPQERAPQYAAAQYAAPPREAAPPASPQYAAPAAQGGPYAAAPYGYAYAPAEQPYTLGSGDRLRIVVFGQEGISNSYIVDAGGNVNLSLIGVIRARGHTTQQLARIISDRLKQGYIREPHVSVEVETYRPFFILGEVTTPGQYPYVANMTAETAIAIAGGFAPRANKTAVKLTRNTPGQQFSGEVPLSYPLRPGDTIVVKERWF
jgi:protein involved in polysaccharide export with SLBB domain